MKDELLDFYAQEAKKNFNSPFLADLQQRALEQFCVLGFPKKSHEDWKYTSTESFQKHFFRPAKGWAEVVDFHRQLPLERHVAIQNGQIFINKALQQQLPQGVVIAPLADALKHYSEKLQAILQQSKFDHGFQALNLASLNSSIVIYIPKNTALATPILLENFQDGEQQAVHHRLFIVMEEGANAVVLEYFTGKNGCTYFTNTFTDISLESTANLTHYKIQHESQTAYHVGHMAVRQAKASELTSHSISIGGKLVRSDIQIDLNEENAHCSMNGIYAPNANQHIDHHTTVNHRVGHCVSEQDYKGILSGKARAVFNGKVIVEKNAQQTIAKQQNKNILLSADAEIDTKPQLEIYADDVVCSHGATVGQLDDEALFYFRTRGISKAAATRYLIHAFAAENLNRISNVDILSWVQQLMNQQMEDAHA